MDTNTSKIEPKKRYVSRDEPNPTSQRNRLDRTFNALYKAVSKILETSGERGLSTARVAATSGISIGSLYRHIKNKEHLITVIAEGGQKIVIGRVTKYLQSIETDPHCRERDPIQIIHDIVSKFVLGFGKGNSYIDGKVSGRSLIRLAWVHEDTDTTAAVANHVGRRITEFLERIQHPELPTPNSATMYVIIRVTLAVLRYASLERSPLLNTNALEDGLTQTIWIMLNKNNSGRSPMSCDVVGTKRGHIDPHLNRHIYLRTKTPLNFEADYQESSSGTRGDQTERHIFKALVDILESEGPDNLKATTVAFRSGFSLTTIYQHFPTKEKMIRMASRYGGDRMQRYVDKFANSLLSDPSRANQMEATEIIGMATNIYTSALLHGYGYLENLQLIQQTFQTIWQMENTDDTIAIMTRAADSISHFWTKMRHPGMPRPPDPTYLFIVTRGITGTARSAILENSPFLKGDALDAALLQMSMVLTHRI